MSIIYSLIAIEPDIVLSEYTEYQGNFMLISRIVLQKYKYKTGIDNEKIEIEYDNFRFYIYTVNRIRLMMITEENGNVRNAFAFLSEVYGTLMKVFDYNHLVQLNAYQLEFRQQLKDLIIYYNTFPIKTKEGLIVKDMDIIKNAVTISIKAMIEKENITKIIVIKDGSGSGIMNDKDKDKEIEMLNISAAVNQIKNEDYNDINEKGRSKGYMIIASGITALLILFYYLI